MSNQVNSNPLYYDSTVSWTGTKFVRQMEWVDDKGDITHDSTLTILVNGVTIGLKVQPLADQLGMGAVIYKAGPFAPGMAWQDVTFTISQGAVIVWLA